MGLAGRGSFHLHKLGLKGDWVGFQGNMRLLPQHLDTCPSTRLVLTKAVRWALAEEHASLQCLAHSPTMAGVRQAGMVSTFSHTRA